MITLDEFTSRTDTALSAKTRADLNAVLVDLPGMVNNELAHARTELKNTMGTTTRKGHWIVPSELVIRNTLGTTNLDFTAADVPPVVNVDLDVSFGSVKLLLPAGRRSTSTPWRSPRATSRTRSATPSATRTSSSGARCAAGPW